MARCAVGPWQPWPRSRKNSNKVLFLVSRSVAESGSDPRHSATASGVRRRTPPLSVVRADIVGPEDMIDAGAEIQLRLRSRHGPEAVTMSSNVRWTASSTRRTKSSEPRQGKF
jgi:hypothetical protein